MTISETACERCRRQKLRCGKERPVCARCGRLNTACCYPEPANRKELAAQRKLRLARPQRRQERRQGSGPGSGPGSAAGVEAIPESLQHTPPYESPQNSSSSLGLPNIPAAGSGGCATSLASSNGQALEPRAQVATSSQGPDSLPPRAIGLALLEIYFERIYNSELLFHKSALFQSYLSGSAAPHLLRAIFALATLFLEQPQPKDTLWSGQNSQRNTPMPPELGVLRAFAASGKAWVADAAAQVLPQVVSPSIQDVQTLLCLGLYSFAKSDMLRAKVYCTVAYTCCSSFSSIAASEEIVSHVPELEDKRRVFWACWASLCVAAIPEAHAKNAWDEVRGVPLPQARGAILGKREFMDQKWRCYTQELPSATHDSHDSVMGEMMKLMGIWARAQILLRQSHSSLNASDLEALSSLAHQTYTSPTFPKTCAHSISENSHLLGLHSLYHLCRMTLLCPLVSIFSGHAQTDSTPKEDASARAQIIIEHAVEQAQWVRDFLSKFGDISTISPLTGFSSFVSASILLNAAKSWISRTEPGEDELRSCLSHVSTVVSETLELLGVLKTYWAPLRLMAQRLLRSAENFHGLTRSIPSSGEPIGALSMSLTGASTPLHGEEAIQMTYVEDQGQTTENTTLESSTWHQSRAPASSEIPNDMATLNFDYEDILHLPFGDDWDVDFMAFTGLG